jgi:rare lipoprotein A
MTRESVAATALFAVILAAATLAACGRFPGIPGQSAHRATNPHPSFATSANVTVVAKTPAVRIGKSDAIAIVKPVSVATVKFVPPAADKPVATEKLAAIATEKAAAARSDASYGLASYYAHGSSRTANGEKFNPRELTAAHRTLPFGTRLRVTELKKGRSVTVRINDRGPFVPGRTVDVSYAAAEQLGIVERGIAKVKVVVVD